MPRIQGTCNTPGCNNLQAIIDYNYRGTGTSFYRKWCGQCHNTRTAAKHGLTTINQVVAKNAGFDSEAEYQEHVAKENGFDSYTDYTNSKHRYRKHRKDHCENVDGRLGFTCNCTIQIPGQLQVDHIDGDPTNDDPENLQTLCANCHIFKTHQEKDYATPGRKKLQEQEKSKKLAKVTLTPRKRKKGDALPVFDSLFVSS